MNQAHGLAATIRCASPLYLTPRFATEREVMLALLEQLVSRAISHEVVLGTDLLREPAETMDRLPSDQ